MWSYALLSAALFTTYSQANPYDRRNYNSSSSSSTYGASSVQDSSTQVHSTTSPTLVTRIGTLSTDISSTATSVFTTSTSLDTGSTSSPSGVSTAISSSSFSSTGLAYSSNSSSIASTNAITGPCTGCVLEAYGPSSTWFSEEWSSEWTSVVVTETILNKTISYFTGTPEALETTVVEYETLNQTKTVVAPGNYTITYTTPVFTVTPTYGVELTLPAGPTYLIYRSLYGGLDYPPEQTERPTSPTTTGILDTETPEPTCKAFVDSLDDLLPTRAEDWSYFIATATGEAPDHPGETPVSLPPGLVDFLKQDPNIQTFFSGSDIASCTLRPTGTYPYRTLTVGLPVPSSSPLFYTPPAPPKPTPSAPVFTPSTTAYLSTTYHATSTHITVRGCLRCDTAVPAPGPTGGDPRVTDDSAPEPTPNPNDQPKPNQNSHGVPGVIASLVNPPRPHDEQQVTIGDSVYPIHPAQPTQPNQPNNPNQHYNPTPGVVIGSQTLTPGQTATINGVPVVVPTAGGGSRIVVGGSTVAVNAAPTGPPILTVGDTTVTANPQGQFVVGSQTLSPGGPAITVDGSTLSLGPSGTIAVVNGVTQTLGSAPFVTGAPVLTVDGKTISATIIGGTTAFVLTPGQTLTPGGIITVDGTTYSMPQDGSGSTVVVNGVTSTLNAPGLPILTVNGQSSITATVEGGTTAFILGPGQTLTPGGVITVSGTTYSMPASASGSVVVINGVTSTLGQGPITAAPALTIDGKTYSATVRDGTTEYVLGPGTTLKPGEAVTISGTTYSLDPKGTALVINGRTSTVPKTPASNSATTTGSASSSTLSSTTSHRDPGNFIASGIGISSKGGAGLARGEGLDKWIEGAVICFAGWLLMLL